MSAFGGRGDAVFYEYTPWYRSMELPHIARAINARFGRAFFFPG
jgi:hypothetical protein